MMMTVISGTANSKAQIWHLFTHGEYFQPQRALFKHWIQTGYLQKKKTTEEDQLSLSRPKLDSVTPSSIWQPSPSLLNRNNALLGFSSGGWSSVLSPGMVPPPPVGQEDVERPQAGCLLLLSHLLVKKLVSGLRQAGCPPTGLPSCLPLHQGLLPPRSIFMTPFFWKMVDPPLHNIAPWLVSSSPSPVLHPLDSDTSHFISPIH